jgi:aminoacrylate hydrolase
VASIIANGITHGYDLLGEVGGTPVALVPGMGGAASYWAPQLASLASTHRVLSYDHRGIGRTTRVPVRDIDELADDFVGLLDALDIPAVHFVGHSTGGAIGLSVAVRHPGRISSMLLYASIHRADAYRRRVFALRRRILEEMGPEEYARTTSLLFYPPAYVAANAAALEAGEVRAVAEIGTPEIMNSRFDAILNFDIAARLCEVRVPTLVLCAQDDMLTPAYFSREIAASIPGAELRLWESGGHALSRTRPAEFEAVLREFLAAGGSVPDGT